MDGAPRQGTASFFATVAASPAGNVYVGWTTQSHEVDLARSSDGGATFAPPVRVDTVLSLPAPFGSACSYRGQTIPAQPRRCVSVNPVVVASSTRVYVVYAVAGADGHEQDVRVTTLDSALAPVGPSAQVNTPDGATVSDQFQPSAALDPVSGLLWLCFYDTTGDRTRRSTRYACAVSRDGAAWSATLPVASARSNETLKGALKGFEYGDYQGLRWARTGSPTRSGPTRAT